MENGERELRKAFEETATRNIRAVIEDVKKNREEMAQIRKEINELKNLVILNNEKIGKFTEQLALLQARIYQGGTDGN